MIRAELGGINFLRVGRDTTSSPLFTCFRRQNVWIVPANLVQSMRPRGGLITRPENRFLDRLAALPFENYHNEK
jgi:hypothetical protein